MLSAFMPFQEGGSGESNNYRVAFSRSKWPISVKSTTRYVCI